MNFDRSAPFDIVIPFRNHPEWLDQCMKSVAIQTEPVRSVTVYDDASDENYESRYSGGKVRYIRKPRRTGALESLKDFHDHLDGNAPGITVALDGDDCFYSDDALTAVRSEYARRDTVATYGGAIVLPSGHQFPVHRHDPLIFPRTWSYGHLMTWRQDLWRLAVERYPKAFIYPEDRPPGYSPSYDVSSFIPMARVAFDEKWRVRPCFTANYLWRTHPDNEQTLHRALQLAEERRVFAIVTPKKEESPAASGLKSLGDGSGRIVCAHCGILITRGSNAQITDVMGRAHLIACPVVNARVALK